MATLPILPDQPAVDPAGDYAKAEAWAMLQARYADAGNYALWAHNTLQALTDEMSKVDFTSALDDELTKLTAVLANVGTPDFTSITDYVSPTAVTYDPIDPYIPETLDTLDSMPTVNALSIPSAPSPSITYTDGAFSDSLLTALKSRLEADLNGVSAAESAMFARHEGRVSSERAKAYNEITTQFSASGWDMPPGALLAKQTEMNNESSKRLTDVSADIMMTSVKESLTGAIQLIDMMGRLNDNKVIRAFESSKASAQLALDSFKTTVEGILGEASLTKSHLEAVVASNEGKVKVFLGKIEGQTAPMKAIAETNQAKAQSFTAAVQGATADVQASAIKPELQLKAAGVNADILEKAASMAIEASMREATSQIESLRGLSQAAMQMIASAMNSVSSSTSFGFSGSAATSYDGSVTEKVAGNLAVAQLKQSPGGY